LALAAFHPWRKFEGRCRALTEIESGGAGVTAIRHFRTGLAVSSTLFLSLAATAGIIPTAAAAAGPAESKARIGHFECRNGRSFDVRLTGKLAAVELDGRSYLLQSRPSSLGAKFTSSSATLIIDGTLGAFVAADKFDLQGCRSTEPFTVWSKG